MTRVETEQTALVRYLRLLGGPQPRGRFIDLRYPDATAPRGMAQRFIAASDLRSLTALIKREAPHTDVYTGVLLRTRRAGGNDAVSASHLLWVELDRQDAVERLTALSVPPTMVIASGSVGHAHAYWLLRTTIDAQMLVSYNRHLAQALDGDERAIDAARILRPPGTLNHKHTPPAPVELIDVDPARRYDLAELLDAFPRPQPVSRPPSRPSTPPAERRGLDRELLSIPAEEYVRQLTGREPNRAGKVNCPFHDDSDPSLQLYPDGTFYCFGCGAGGSLYDFAAKLWGLSTKQRDFLELRQRLVQRLKP